MRAGSAWTLKAWSQTRTSLVDPTYRQGRSPRISLGSPSVDESFASSEYASALKGGIFSSKSNQVIGVHDQEIVGLLAQRARA